MLPVVAPAAPAHDRLAAATTRRLRAPRGGVMAPSCSMREVKNKEDPDDERVRRIQVAIGARVQNT
jgi:hypothetical protein